MYQKLKTFLYVRYFKDFVFNIIKKSKQLKTFLNWYILGVKFMCCHDHLDKRQVPFSIGSFLFSKFPVVHWSLSISKGSPPHATPLLSPTTQAKFIQKTSYCICQITDKWNFKKNNATEHPMIYLLITKSALIIIICKWIKYYNHNDVLF